MLLQSMLRQTLAKPATLVLSPLERIKTYPLADFQPVGDDLLIVIECHFGELVWQEVSDFLDLLTGHRLPTDRSRSIDDEDDWPIRAIVNANQSPNLYLYAGLLSHFPPSCVGESFANVNISRRKAPETPARVYIPPVEQNRPIPRDDNANRNFWAGVVNESTSRAVGTQTPFDQSLCERVRAIRTELHLKVYLEGRRLEHQ